MAEKDRFDWGSAIRAVYGRHAVKKLARALRVAGSTAKLWLSSGVSNARALDLAEELLIEIDRQEAERIELRRRLFEIRDAIRGRHELAAAHRRARKGKLEATAHPARDGTHSVRGVD